MIPANADWREELIEHVTLSNSPMFHIAISFQVAGCHRARCHRPHHPSTDPVNPGHNTDACDVGARTSSFKTAM